MTPKEREQFKVDCLNEMQGDRNLSDGYDCPLCKNRGVLYKLVEENGWYYHTAYDCNCFPIRRSILKMKRSGLKDVIKECTFDKWIAAEPWQIAMKKAAVDYAKSPQGWFFVGGQSGCGKTHLCTAICRELLLSGIEVRYMQWRDDAVKLKSLTKEPEQRQKLIDDFKKAEVLYIDDLFKTGKAQDGSEQRPTGADVNIAFEILNYRYNNPKAYTVISSELSAEELLDIDEAIGGRIYERAKPLNISKDRKKNYRIRNQITL